MCVLLPHTYHITCYTIASEINRQELWTNTVFRNYEVKVTNQHEPQVPVQPMNVYEVVEVQLHALWTKVHIFQDPLPSPLVNTIGFSWIHSIPSKPISVISALILPSNLSLVPSNIFFPSYFKIRDFVHFHLPHACYKPGYLIMLDFTAIVILLL